MIPPNNLLEKIKVNTFDTEKEFWIIESNSIV